MNESPRHFIGVCPKCSASLKINREHAGQNVTCKHCDHSFLAEVSKEPINASREEGTASPSIQQAGQAERIVVVCPSCHATLRVRRAYLGRQVLCKQCNHTFLVRDPANSQPESAVSDHHGGTSKTSLHQPDIESGSLATESEYDRLRTEHDRLLAEHQRLLTEHRQLQEADSRHAAGHARYKLKYKQVGEELTRVTTDLGRIRAHLGTIAPEDVCSLVEERESLRAEVERLRGALDLADATHRVERDRIHAELATLNDQHRQLRDQQESTDQLCKQYLERNQELVQAHNRLESDFQLMLHTVRLQEQRAAEQLDRLGFPNGETADRANQSRSDNVNPAHALPALVAELEAVRAQVEDLKRRLDTAERNNRDLFETLKIAGIRYKPVA
jgi:predicted Zn finger-like uncharacterized protein